MRNHRGDCKGIKLTLRNSDVKSFEISEKIHVNCNSKPELFIIFFISYYF